MGGAFIGVWNWDVMTFDMIFGHLPIWGMMHISWAYNPTMGISGGYAGNILGWSSPTLGS